MVECCFADANMTKVDFQGTVFVRCAFEGKLEDVLFYRFAFKGEKFLPNEMKEVDFRRAKFHFVEFRGLDMATVAWPEGDDHIIVDDYHASLERALRVFGDRSDMGAKRLVAIFTLMKKWAGPRQRRGVVSRAELVEAGGEGAVEDFMRLVLRAPR